MKILITGSSGHLGEALMRLASDFGMEATGLDLIPGSHTQLIGSITDRNFVFDHLSGFDAVVHGATLHKPHVATHSRQAFVDTNISGTLNLLEAAIQCGVGRFVYSSTTSTFGSALSPPNEAPAVWVEESVQPIVKNIYGLTKLAAENLCELFSTKPGLTCTVLRLSRFFPEEDDNKTTRDRYSSDNAKANEFLYRRVDIQDAAQAHFCALNHTNGADFSRYIISAPTPFRKEDLGRLRQNPARVVGQYFPDFHEIYRRANFKMFDDIERIYVSRLAQQQLSWVPEFDFGTILNQLNNEELIGSRLGREIGKKGYHTQSFAEGPYPVE